MDWIASDFHFGHTNIAGPKVSNWKDGYRDFESVDEMNKTITDTVNKYVKEDDTLYFLGDFGFGGHKNIPVHRSGLICRNIHLIRGNHDHHIDKYAHLFSSVQDVLELLVDGQRYFLSHYAHRVWYHSHKGVIHLYGHSHGSIPDYGKSMDVGIDVAYRMFSEYRPFTFKEVREIMSKKEIVVVDHHATRN